MLEQVHESHRWENQLAPDWVKISDLDEEEVQITLKNATALGRMAPIKDASTTSILQGLGLIKDGYLLNAVIALYGKGEAFMPQFPQLSLRLARFRGIDRLADFSDSREYWGHAFSLLRRSEHFLLDHMPIAGRVVPGKMIREDCPLYPPRAFREAVANAICHRDYIQGSGSVGIAIYDDHVEVISPGGFHFDITPEKLIIPHESKPWNPLDPNCYPKPFSAFSFNTNAFEQRLDQLLTNKKYQDNANIIKTALHDEKDGVKLTIDTILKNI